MKKWLLIGAGVAAVVVVGVAIVVIPGGGVAAAAVAKKYGKSALDFPSRIRQYM